MSSSRGISLGCLIWKYSWLLRSEGLQAFGCLQGPGHVRPWAAQAQVAPPLRAAAYGHRGGWQSATLQLSCCPSMAPQAEGKQLRPTSLQLPWQLESSRRFCNGASRETG